MMILEFIVVLLLAAALTRIDWKGPEREAIEEMDDALWESGR